MALSTAMLVPLVPVVLGAVALGRVVFETALDDRGPKEPADAGAVLAALTALALFLLSLDALPELQARVFLGLLAGALWLAGRARRDARLAPLVFLSAGVLAGAELRLGLALVPALGVLLFAALSMAEPARVLLRALLVLLLGASIGLLLARYGLRHAFIAPRLFDAQRLSAWAQDTTHKVGAIGMAFAAGGLLLALLGARARRVLALSSLALLFVDAATGGFGAATSVAVAMAVGLGLMEARLRLVKLALPGASVTLVPLAFLVLLEPLGARLGSQHYTWPSLGPVPPRQSPRLAPAHAGAVLPPVRRAPVRGGLADTVRR